MKKTAIVKFVGDPEYYRMGCDESEFLYCRDCERFIKTCEKSTKSTKCRFLFGHLYNAYFLEYWQGERTSLHVKGEDGAINDFNQLSDFEVVEDTDGVLNGHEATVRCVTHAYEGDLASLYYGREYKAIGFTKSGTILVMDESLDCYFYPHDAFEIVSDTYGVLDGTVSLPVYDWHNTHEDSV